jgi:hypothetical protein
MIFVYCFLFYLFCLTTIHRSSRYCISYFTDLQMMTLVKHLISSFRNINNFLYLLLTFIIYSPNHKFAG